MISLPRLALASVAALTFVSAADPVLAQRRPSSCRGCTPPR